MATSVSLPLSLAELAELLHEFDIEVDGRFRMPVTRQTETDRLRAFFKVLRAQAKALGVQPPPVKFAPNQIDILADALLAAPAKAAAAPKPAKAPSGKKRGRPRKHPRQSTIDEALVDDAPAMPAAEHAAIMRGAAEADA